MIEVTNKAECCGCTACARICPKNCIDMKEDNEGFYYPKVRTEDCILCGACKRVCPILNVNNEQLSKQKAFIVQNLDNKVLSESTAGGAFTAIAKYVLKNDGVVFGVTMMADYSIHHVYVEHEHDLWKFRNSKYVQSNPKDSFIQVKRFLEQGRVVCFSGTPCQIEGIRRFLSKDYDKLILVDVVCRAVPSPGVWRKYITNFVCNNGEQKSIRFRDKTLGYQYSTMELVGLEGKVNRGGIESQQWLRMFFSGMIIRPSCAECKFRKQHRISDFTIWDCFIVYEIDSSFDDNCGTTRILIHSDKGINIFEKIKSDFKYKEIPVEIAVKDVKEMFESPSIHPKREQFFTDYENIDFGVLLNQYFSVGTKQKLKRFLRCSMNRLGIDRYIKKVIRHISKSF